MVEEEKEENLESPKANKNNEANFPDKPEWKNDSPPQKDKDDHINEIVDQKNNTSNLNNSKAGSKKEEKKEEPKKKKF